MDDFFNDASSCTFEVIQGSTFEKFESWHENKTMGKGKRKKKKKSKQPSFADEEYLESTFQTSTLQPKNQTGKSSQTSDKEFSVSGSISREPDAAFSSIIMFNDEKIQLQGRSVANPRVSLDSDWFSSKNLSVVSDELSSKLTTELSNVPSEYRMETNTTFQLLVGYLVSMGTDLQTSEELAMSFMAQEGMLDKMQGQKMRVQQSQSRDSTLSAQGVHESSRKQFYLTSPRLRASSPSELLFPDEEGSFDAGLNNQPVAQATEVQDCEIELPIVYAETSKIGFKDLVKEPPIKIALMIGLLGLFLLIGGIAAILVYKGKTAGPVLAPTSFPSMSPSSSPTLIQDDILLAAVQLSGEDFVSNSTSPQFRAVAWMSNFDAYITDEIGEAFAQRYAMVVIFFSFVGEEWTSKENWLDPLLHECDWSAGITCNDKAAAVRLVTGFDATRNNLQGSIPPEISLLTALQTFRIPKNNVGGTIPSALGSLTSLSSLDCSSNLIEGSLPTTIGSATSLVSIDFTQNKLLSSLPTGLFTLRDLQTISLSFNNLNGSLPEALQNLSALVTLDLSNNNMTGTLPLSLDSIPSIARIYLDHNQLTGKLPYLTSALALIEVISLGHNKFSGNLELSPGTNAATIVSMVQDFRLRYVDLSYNELSGPVSPVLGFLPTMRFFDISGNNFTGSFPSAIGWDGIEYLAAAENEFTGTIPVGYPTLTHLDMSSNRFLFDIPDELCEFEGLKYLNLSRNMIGSTIPSCFGSLSPLQVLDLSNNYLLSSIPAFLGQLTALEMLEMENNSLTGSLPSQLGDLAFMKKMSFSENGLVGTIPLELGKLTKLQSFQVSNNSLTGSLPPEMSAWIELESLKLAGNNIVGSIPQAICNIDDLKLRWSDIGCSIQCGCCVDSGSCSGDLQW